MGTDATFIQEIVRRVLSVIEPERIILFGSAVTGQTTADSDIDLLILHSSSNGSWQDRARIRQALFGMGKAFDLIILSTERFEQSKSIIGSIAWPAATSGKVIYEAA